MKIEELKREVADLQSRGEINQAVQLMYTTWKLNKCDFSIATLFIAECYWLLQERDYFKDNPQGKRNGYDEIDWGFESYMQEVLLYGLSYYENVSEFLWKIGRLFCVDFMPFLFLYSHGIEVSEYGKKMLEQAEMISPDNILIQLMNDDKRNWDDDMIIRARSEISSIIYETYSDQELRFILSKMLEARIYESSCTT